VADAAVNTIRENRLSLHHVLKLVRQHANHLTNPDINKLFFPTLIPLIVSAVILGGCTQSGQQQTSTTASTSTTPSATSSTSTGNLNIAEPASSGQNSVTVSNFAFNPPEITVKSGTAVTWTNQDSMMHTITAPGLFDSGTLGQGKTFSYTFTDSGTFDYGCSIHPSMKGKVTVTP
jgi:plastocyanin